MTDYIRELPEMKHPEAAFFNLFLRRRLLKTYMTYPWRKKFLKNIYDRKIALLKASNTSFLDCPCSSLFKFFDVALPNSETSIVNLSEFVEHDRIKSKEATKRT